MQTKLILTLLGIFMAALVSILKRNKLSTNTPDKFDIIFYIKDTWITHLLSALLSISLVLTYHFAGVDEYVALKIGDSESLAVLEALLSWLCGFAPHLALALLDNMSKVFTPKIVKHEGETFYRK